MNVATSQDTVRDEIVVKDLGLMEYAALWAAMRQFTDARDASTLDEIWCVQHLPTYTQGQAGKAEHILMATSHAFSNIPLIQSDRGGQVTYHGPGQLVVYPLLNLKRRKLGVRDLVTKIENSVIALLAQLDIPSAAKPDAPGVYVNERKIASLGLRVRKGCSFHGVAINVDMDLDPFSGINPCGYSALKMTQVINELPNFLKQSALATNGAKCNGRLTYPSNPAFFEQIKKQYMSCLLAELDADAS